MPIINTIDLLFTSEKGERGGIHRDRDVYREIKRGAYLLLSILYTLLTLMKETN